MEKIPVFVETLKQLYVQKKIDVAKIKGMYTKNIITVEEYDWILSKNNKEKGNK